MAGVRKLKTSGDAIVSDPNVLMGKPVVRGTRISVELILEKLGAGETVDDLLSAHPSLTRDGIGAALVYAAKVLKTDLVDALPRAKA